MNHLRSRLLVAVLTALALAAPSPSDAQKKYGPGASDTEIKIGNTIPYSGPASAYGTEGRTAVAFFRMVNDQGGINGRKINFISLDDGYSPPKTVEATRRLVEEDRVLFLFYQLGTATNSAIHKYVNSMGVPHLFISTGATKWADPKHYP
jgi:branched-chain amino acid transport system substrate-binding protein